MKQQYVKPDSELLTFDVKDVLTASETEPETTTTQNGGIGDYNNDVGD